MQRQLETLSKRAVPYAARELVNGLAFAGRVAWQREMQDALTLRNRFTERRALVDPARTLRIRAMEARLGHTEEYMRLLEEGKPERAAKRWRPIVTEIGAGQARGSLRGGRKRAVLPKRIITKLGSLKVSGIASLSRKARNARSIQGAIRSGRRLALLDLGHRKGVYRITGGKRKPIVSELYNLSHRKTRMPRIPLLQRALTRALKAAPYLANVALERQLARLKGAR